MKENLQGGSFKSIFENLGFAPVSLKWIVISRDKIGSISEEKGVMPISISKGGMRASRMPNYRHLEQIRFPFNNKESYFHHVMVSRPDW